MISKFLAICLVCMAVVACELEPQDVASLQEAMWEEQAEPETARPICADTREEIFYMATGCVAISSHEQACTCHYRVTVTPRYPAFTSDGILICVEGEPIPEEDVTRDCIISNYDSPNPLGQHGHTCIPNPVP